MPTLALEQESLAAPGEARHDAAGHLSRSVYTRLLGAEAGGLAEAVLPHLIECPACREALRQAIHQAGLPMGHPYRVILEDAEAGAGWAAAGQTAAAATCRQLTEQGIGYVYGRDGRVYRRLPGGEEEQVAPEASPPA